MPNKPMLMSLSLRTQLNNILAVLILCSSACFVAEATPPPRAKGGVAQATIETARYEVKGMACQSCASRLEVGIRKLDGVTKAHVDFSTKILTVHFNASKTDAPNINKEIERNGFEAKQVSHSPGRRR